jgi:hypothetical protein
MTQYDEEPGNASTYVAGAAGAVAGAAAARHLSKNGKM